MTYEDATQRGEANLHGAYYSNNDARPGRLKSMVLSMDTLCVHFLYSFALEHHTMRPFKEDIDPMHNVTSTCEILLSSCPQPL